MIRLARDTDIDVLEKIYIQAKAYLRSIGNNIQWTGEYPSRRTVSDDIALKRLYVCEYDGIIAGRLRCATAPIRPTATSKENGEETTTTKSYTEWCRRTRTRE